MYTRIHGNQLKVNLTKADRTTRSAVRLDSLATTQETSLTSPNRVERRDSSSVLFIPVIAAAALSNQQMRPAQE